MARYLDELGLTTLVRLISKKLNDVHEIISEALNKQHKKDIELEDALDRSNKTVAAALNDLNERKADVSDLNNLQENVETLDVDIKQCMEDNELVVASALTDLHVKKLDTKNIITIEEINNL